MIAALLIFSCSVEREVVVGAGGYQKQGFVFKSVISTSGWLTRAKTYVCAEVGVFWR